jgi:signal peptidase I
MRAKGSPTRLLILCQTIIRNKILLNMEDNNLNQTSPAQEPKKENFFKEILKFTVIALAIVIPVRAYIAQPFVVSGASMDPTFETGEYLIVDELSYRFNEPSRGQVIIFKFPRDPKTFFIKRIIGLPGETVDVRQGKVTVIDKDSKTINLEEPYVNISHMVSDTFIVTLGENEYFVMGDNRAQSSDSRSWGPLERKFIVGRPIVRLLPIDKIDLLPGNFVEQRSDE